MSGPSAGSLNSLLKYRFTRKPTSSLNEPDSATLSKENSTASVDSQATIPYNGNGSQEEEESQSTQPYELCNGTQATVTPGNAAVSTPASPVFTSKVSSSAQERTCIAESPITPHAPPSPGPWISFSSKQKATGNDSNDIPTQQAAKFKRVMRPIDSDSDGEIIIYDSDVSDTEEVPEVKPPTSFERLKKMFPNGSENRMRAALIVHPNNFDEAAEFVKNDLAAHQVHGQVKRKAPAESPDGKPAYKRIKPMPESPSEPTVLSIDYLKKLEEQKAEKHHFQKQLEFLRGCYPALSADYIKQVLKSHNGNADEAAETLSKKQEQQTNRMGDAASSGNGSLLKKNSLSGSKVKKKRTKDEDDFSEDEDEYSDYDDSNDSDELEDLDNRSKTQQDNYLQFFEEAAAEELKAMPGCTQKKAEFIMTFRPFQTWDRLIEVLTTEKSLSVGLISGCKEVMQVRNTVRRLMVRCESISKQMNQVVSRLTASALGQGGDDGLQIAKQPELLNKQFKLQPYQLIGLSWLRIMHEQELNGILADEMGLGKTIQAIAFVAHLMEEGEEGPHVIVVPSSTIENWLRELQLWCPDIKVVVYYGSQDERRAVRHSIFDQGEQFNVLLTTYNMATGGAGDRVLFKKFQFHYAVFDEGHMLKNMASMRFQNLMKISAERRLLLTGTPLQNNLLELMSLLCFVMPEIFHGKTDHLKKVFDSIRSSTDRQKSRFERDRIAQAKRIMKPFVLRRLKKDVLQHLPNKSEHIEKCSMSTSQQQLYDRLLAKYSQEISQVDKEEPDTPDEKSSGKKDDKRSGIGIFMQFRKASCHPLLLRNHFKKSKLRKMANAIAKEPSHRDRGALPELILEDLSVMNDFELMALCKEHPKYLSKFDLDPSVIPDSGKFNKLDELLPGMKERGDRVLLFSQFTMMLDVVELYLNQRGHSFIRLDGQTPVVDRLQLIDRFNNEPDIFIFLLSTRAGGVGINLCAANTIIIHDIDFNPYNDKQAEDRCHRLGQKREVHVHKLICESTVDEAMLECANGKLALERDLQRPEGEEDTEDNTKDVVKMLKEVLRLRQKENQSQGVIVLDDDDDDDDDEDDDANIKS